MGLVYTFTQQEIPFWFTCNFRKKHLMLVDFEQIIINF